MPSATNDSLIFRDIFSTEAMRRVFTDRARVQYYLDIEASLARVQARLGIIPKEAAEEIERHCHAEQFDFPALKRETERIGYPVLPVVQQLVGLCRNGLGEWCHWGATTQDITDTAAVMQVRDGLIVVEQELEAICAALTSLATRYRDTPMAGRSNLQQAVPITFGYKMAVLLAGFQRHLQRLREIRPRVLVCEFGGAAGNLSSLGNDGLKVQAALCVDLGLGQPEIAWHTMRDRIAEVGCFLGLVTGTAGKVSMDVKLMMQTEVEEVFEPFADQRGSSSTMPQKRNPISSNYIHACTAVVRQHVAALLDAMVADHERSTGPWEIEWIVLPEIFLLASGALAHARELVSGLQVDPERMRRNLDLTRGLLLSEAVMMRLGPAMGRQRAHDRVYDLCRRAISAGRPLLDVLAGDQEILSHVGREELAKLLDPSNYLGLSGEMVDRVVRNQNQ
jgi:3-carboxy-cis,cis-muconate cycloisomerase